jgi:putative endonuclease
VPVVSIQRPPRAAAHSRPDVGRGDHRRALGRLGEDLADAHLTRLGFSTLARNVRTRAGEIDLIVFEPRQGTLVFVEVKTRRVSATARGVRPEQEPLSRLRPRQCARLRRLAIAWLHEPERSRPRARTIRFDAIGVIVDQRDQLLRIDHIEAAW